MAYSVATGNFILVWLIPIAGFFIAAITAFGVFYGPKLVAKRQEKKEKLKIHFEGLKQSIIVKIFQIITGVINDYGTLEASTLRGNMTMEDAHFPILFGFEEMDEYQAFQAHYPEIDKTWRELIALIWKQNEDVESALGEIEEYINENPDLPPVKKYYPLTEEKVISGTIPLIYRAIYSIAKGENPQCDFSKLHVDDYNEYQHIIVNKEVVAVTTKDRVDRCMSAFLELQTSETFKNRTQGLASNAFQLSKRLESLANMLKNIHDYGLISNKVGYKFAQTKDCIICKRIF
jgi:hypothetical protein